MYAFITLRFTLTDFTLTDIQIVQACKSRATFNTNLQSKPLINEITAIIKQSCPQLRFCTTARFWVPIDLQFLNLFYSNIHYVPEINNKYNTWCVQLICRHIYHSTYICYLIWIIYLFISLNSILSSLESSHYSCCYPELNDVKKKLTTQFAVPVTRAKKAQLEYYKVKTAKDVASSTFLVIFNQHCGKFSETIFSLLDHQHYYFWCLT